MLELRAVSVRYGAVQAVTDLDLDVAAGEVVAVLGANGAGKTTTLRAATGLVPYAGTIRFDGADVAATGVEALARRGLVHVPEGRRVFPTLTVHENLLMGQPARAGRTGGHGVDDVYDLFPALVPLTARDGWALSGGEQQMVAVGRALVAAPRLLLLDEPSLGLAPILVQQVFSTIREINAQGTTVLLVEQNALMALEVAHRGYVLETGSIVLADNAAALRENPMVRNAYLGIG